MIIMGHCLLSQLHSNVIFHSPPHDCFHSIPSFFSDFERFLIQDRKKLQTNKKDNTRPKPVGNAKMVSG